MMIIVTRNAPEKLRGYLASTLLEIESGIYFSQVGSPRVRAQIWEIVMGWAEIDTGAVMIYHDKNVPHNFSFEKIGSAPIELKEVDGMLLSFKRGSLKT